MEGSEASGGKGGSCTRISYSGNEEAMRCYEEAEKINVFHYKYSVICFTDTCLFLKVKRF